MKCPYCSHEFPLTWPRYVRAPFGRHVCPCCQKKSKLKFTRRYIASLLQLFVFQILLTTVLLAIYLAIYGATVIVFAGAVIAVVIWMPIDKYTDAQRPLVQTGPDAGNETETKSNT